MIAISTFDLTLGAIALAGYGAILGFWAGVKYGRARTHLATRERHARAAAAVGGHYRSWKEPLEKIVELLGEVRADQAKAPPRITIDFSVIAAVASEAGYNLVPKNATAGSELRH